MGFRRSKARSAARREWMSFIGSHADVIHAAGLPQAITASIERWDEFLLRGYAEVDLDWARFSVDQLSEAQSAALRQLADSYFAAGYAYFTPHGLPDEAQQQLKARYGPPDD